MVSSLYIPPASLESYIVDHHHPAFVCIAIFHPARGHAIRIHATGHDTRSESHGRKDFVYLRGITMGIYAWRRYPTRSDYSTSHANLFPLAFAKFQPVLIVGVHYLPSLGDNFAMRGCVALTSWLVTRGREARRNVVDHLATDARPLRVWG